MLALVSSAGCSALISPDESRLGGGRDGGAGRPDAPIRLLDGSTLPPDAPQADRPPVGCEPTDPMCDGDVLVECIGGVERRTDCAARGGECSSSDGPGAACTVAPMCTPVGSRCDGGDLVTCHGDGSETRTPCPLGCDNTLRACVSAPTCPGIPALALGMTTFNLCEESDDYTHSSMDGCATDERANAGDRIFRLDIAVDTTVVLDLLDTDGSVGIDTLLYVRRNCEDAMSQVACSDDILCTDSVIRTGCIGGYQLRESRIVLRLEPGTYYVVADAFLYATSSGEFRCGVVTLTYDTI